MKNKKADKKKPVNTKKTFEERYPLLFKPLPFGAYSTNGNQYFGDNGEIL